jgi:hypothetical protein
MMMMGMLRISVMVLLMRRCLCHVFFFSGFFRSSLQTQSKAPPRPHSSQRGISLLCQSIAAATSISHHRAGPVILISRLPSHRSIRSPALRAQDKAGCLGAFREFGPRPQPFLNRRFCSVVTSSSRKAVLVLLRTVHHRSNWGRGQF